MVTFRESVIGVILVAIFAFALIGFGVTFATQNDINQSIGSDPIINKTYSDIETALEDTAVDAETQKESWFEDVPLIQAINLVWKSLTGILRVFFSTLINLYNLLVTLVSTTIGIPTVVLNAITAIISISMILLLWSIVRSGR